MSESVEVITKPSLEERRLDLEFRALALREREASTVDRAARSPDEQALDCELRKAKTLAASPFLPSSIGTMGENGPDNARISAAWGVLRFAALLNVDPCVLAQQIYVVHGRVGFSASFLIGLVNDRAGLRKRISWTSEGSGPTLSVTCSATNSDGEEVRVTMTMAQVEKWGWARKPGEPWKADPELMLRYRTATQLIRLYFAGAVMGLTMSSEELRDVEAVEVVVQPRRQIGARGSAGEQLAQDLAQADRKSDAIETGPTAEERAQIEADERAQAARDAAARQGADDEGMP
jgi:hypothetical protein